MADIFVFIESVRVLFWVAGAADARVGIVPADLLDELDGILDSFLAGSPGLSGPSGPSGMSGGAVRLDKFDPPETSCGPDAPMD